MIRMVNIIEGGKCFTRSECGVNTTYSEITEEEYNRILSMDNWRAKLNGDYDEKMSDSVRYGYGFYGCDLKRLDDGFYYTVSIGSSCD